MKWILLALASLPMLGQSTGVSKPPSAPPPNVISKFGGLVDDTQGKDFQGKVTWIANDALTLFISGVRSNLASTTQAPSPNGNDTTTTTTSLGGSYSFGLFELGLQYDHSDLSDLLTSRRYYFQPAFDGGSWRLGFEFSSRTTDFDRLRFNNLAISTVTGPVFVTGYADMSVKDTGIGATCEFIGEVWRPYASYTRYSYGPFGGKTDVTRIMNTSGQVNPEVFMALSGRMVSRLERLSDSRLSRKAALLDSSATAGIEADLRHTKWGIEANRDVDHLTGEISATYTGTVGWKINRRFTLECQAGATRSEAFGTSRFMGLTGIFRTRPGS